MSRYWLFYVCNLPPATSPLYKLFGLKLWCFLYAECHYQGERQRLVCVKVAGVNDIGNASPVSIGTVRNSVKINKNKALFLFLLRRAAVRIHCD